MEALSDQPKATQPRHPAPDRVGQESQTDVMAYPQNHACGKISAAMDVLRSSERRFPILKPWVFFTTMPARPYFSCPTSSGCTGPSSHTDFVQASKCCCSESMFSSFISTQSQKFQTVENSGISITHPTHQLSTALVSQSLTMTGFAKILKDFLFKILFIAFLPFFFFD